MTATTAPSHSAAPRAVAVLDLPLGRLLTREQVLLWLKWTDDALDRAVADGRVLAVRYADAPERYPQVQFNRRRCTPEQIAVALAAFAALDWSGVLAACWLASSAPVLDLAWQGSRITVINDCGWPTITVKAL